MVGTAPYVLQFQVLKPTHFYHGAAISHMLSDPRRDSQTDADGDATDHLHSQMVSHRRHHRTLLALCSGWVPSCPEADEEGVEAFGIS